MATGRERLDSDLDLLVVTSDTASAGELEQRIQDLRTLVYRKFSIPLSPHIQPLAEIRAKLKKKLPLILRILEEGQCIYGKDLKELLQLPPRNIKPGTAHATITPLTVKRPWSS